MKSLWGAQVQHDWYPYKKQRTLCEDTDSVITQYFKDGGKDWSNGTTSQGVLGVTRSWKGQGRALP